MSVVGEEEKKEDVDVEEEDDVGEDNIIISLSRPGPSQSLFSDRK